MGVLLPGRPGFVGRVACGPAVRGHARETGRVRAIDDDLVVFLQYREHVGRDRRGGSDGP